MKSNSSDPFTCPWWLLFTFDNPFRKLVHQPKEILKTYVNPGDTVLDVGCGMGYFTLELAKMVGESGRVIAADLQSEMLAGLQKRVERADLLSRIQLHRTEQNRIGVDTPIDFALAFWMVHEVQDQTGFLQEIYGVLKPGGHLLIVEPWLHVSERAFAATLARAEEVGFHDGGNPRVGMSRAVLLQK